MTERELQMQIRAGLRKLGFVVLSTSGMARAKYARNNQDRGIPDLLVSRKGWGCWYGLEVKLPKGPVSPEQQELVELGLVTIVRSLDDALEALMRFDPRVAS